MFRVLVALPNLSTSTEVWTITGVWTGKLLFNWKLRIFAVLSKKVVQ